jgi:hypothetical protein
MKTLVMVTIALLCLTCHGWTSMGVNVGSRSYDGDFCQACKSEGSAAKSLGVHYRTGILLPLELGIGLDYTWGSLDGDCADSEDAEFSHSSAHAIGTFPIFSLVFAKLYVGGGISRNWFDFADLKCDAGPEETRTGYMGIAGLKAQFPSVVLESAFVEWRLERLGGSPDITTSGIYLGASLSL